MVHVGFVKSIQGGQKMVNGVSLVNAVTHKNYYLMELVRSVLNLKDLRVMEEVVVYILFVMKDKKYSMMGFVKTAKLMKENKVMEQSVVQTNAQEIRYSY